MREIVDDRRAVVACLGSSSTAGQGQAFGWINELERRPQNQRFDFRNLGVGGDLAYNALQRVPAVIACHPDKVVVLIGANDALTMVFANARRVLAGWMKRIPKEPSVELFRESLEAIVELRKANKKYAGVPAIEDIDFALLRGEIHTKWLDELLSRRKHATHRDDGSAADAAAIAAALWQTMQSHRNSRPSSSANEESRWKLEGRREQLDRTP